jgi:hypothetical protein
MQRVDACLSVIPLAQVSVHDGWNSAKRMTLAALLTVSFFMYYLLYLLNEALLIL